MNKLLAANFVRLKKSKVFWVCMLLSAVFALLMDFSLYRMLREGGEPTLEGSLFAFVPFIGIVGAAFVSLFIGTEYSDGTIRNKIIIGHSRGAVYLANLITCGVGGLLMCLVYMVIYTSLGAAIIGWFTIPMEGLLLLLLCCVALTVCLISIMTVVVMLNQNKAVTAVLSIILALALLFAGSYTMNCLNQPEYYAGYEQAADGTIQREELHKNPRYLSGTTREIYEFVSDFTPGGQQIRFGGMQIEHPWRMTGYSALITIVVTGAGVTAFRRKDLK